MTSETTGITDVEWLDVKVCELSVKCERLERVVKAARKIIAERDETVVPEYDTEAEDGTVAALYRDLRTALAALKED